MSLGVSVAVDVAGGHEPAVTPWGALLAGAAEPALADMDPDTTVRWALDVSAARSLMASIASGEGPVDWSAQLLARTIVADANLNAVHALAGFGRGRALIGRPIATCWPPESHEALAAVLLAAAAGYPAGAPTSRPITSIAFDAARVSASMAPTRLGSDLVLVSVGGTVPDQRSLWDLQVSERRYRNLTHHMPFAVLQVDSTAMLPIFEELRHEGVTDILAHMDRVWELSIRSRNIVRVTDANIEAAALFGASEVGQLVGPVDVVFEASPETAKRVIRAHFEGRRRYAELMKVRRFDGSLIDVELGVTYPTPPERLEVTLLTLVDVTERLRTEAQLRQLQADYSRAARISMLGELATSIAHEVNQPLSAIVTNAETSLRWLARADPNLAKVKQLTGRIVQSARDASAIVKGIRSMASRGATDTELLDINEVVAEALTFVRHDFESRAIDLKLDLEGALPLVRGDRVQLQQVLVNLLINAQQAVSHNPAGGTIEVVTARAGPGQVAISVRDDGPGIAETDLARIFDSFFTTKREGIGIGLAICQSIVAAHGGTLAVDKSPLGGAAFSVTLPAAPPP